MDTKQEDVISSLTREDLEEAYEHLVERVTRQTARIKELEQEVRDLGARLDNLIDFEEGDL